MIRNIFDSVKSCKKIVIRNSSMTPDEMRKLVEIRDFMNGVREAPKRPSKRKPRKSLTSDISDSIVSIKREFEKCYDLDTDIDRMMCMIQKAKMMKMKTVAQKLEVERMIVEKWAHMLEKRGVMKIHYPVIGSPVLKAIQHKNSSERRYEYQRPMF